MPAQEIESAQVLRAWQTLAYTFGAIDGAILVKTRSSVTRYEPPSKGAFYTPTGLSKLSDSFEPKPWKAEKPGRYRLLEILWIKGIALRLFPGSELMQKAEFHIKWWQVYGWTKWLKRRWDSVVKFIQLEIVPRFR